MNLLPFPTMFLPVSGNSRSIVPRITADDIDRNQKIDGQIHRRRSSPLIIGAILAGVFRLAWVSQRHIVEMLVQWLQQASAHTRLQQPQYSLLVRRET